MIYVILNYQCLEILFVLLQVLKIFFVYYRFLDNEDDSFFEIKITVDEITKDVSLIITDFADEDEVEESKMLWDSQISDLKSVIGSS